MAKLHGSLSQSGKVRKQTPKVAPSEKKKKLTGRAHKRAKYTRRFVTQASSTFGPKKGMNPQVSSR